MKSLRSVIAVLIVLALVQAAYGQGMLKIHYDDGRVDTLDMSRVTKVEFIPGSAGINLNGVWKTTEGELMFQQNGTMITGSYQPNDHGQIVGTLSGNVLEGYWIEDSSGRKCSSAQYGRYYWGKVRFVFDGNTFSGAWGYCEGAPGQSWSGSRQ